MRLLQWAACAGLLVSIWAPVPSPAISEFVHLDRAKRGNVAFTHQKHAYDYGISCERCHHNIEPIRAGETSCRGCHAGRQHNGLCHRCHISSRDVDYRKRSAALEKELQLPNVPNLFKAFHNLCRNCHAEENDRQNTSAPYECSGCHDHRRTP